MRGFDAKVSVAPFLPNRFGHSRWPQHLSDTFASLLPVEIVEFTLLSCLYVVITFPPIETRQACLEDRNPSQGRSIQDRVRRSLFDQQGKRG
jgi:hypothetical protein